MSDQINDSGVDSRATDFVFGEMSPEETKRFQEELERSPELRAEVESIREAVAAVQAELDGNLRGVSDAGRRQIQVAIAGSSAPQQAGVVTRPDAESSSSRRVLVGLAVAASVLLIGVLAWPVLWPQPDTSFTSGVATLDDGDARAKDLRGDDEFARLAEENRSEESSDPMLGTQTNPTKDLNRSGRVSGADHSGDPTEAALSDLSAHVAGTGARTEFDEAAAEGEAMPSAVQKSEPQDTPDLPALQAPEGAPQPRYASQPPYASQPQSGSGAAPFGAAAAGAMKESGASEFSDEAFSNQVESEGKLNRGVTRDRSRKNPEPSDTKSYHPQPFGVAGNEAKGQELQLFAETDALAVVPEMPKEEAARPVARGGLGVASKTNTRHERLGGAAKADELFGVEEQVVIDGGGFGRGPGMGGDQHDLITDNPFKKVVEAPLSTFSIDVDTASYSKVRMYLMQHQMLPRPDAVRIEELLNYFTYDYTPPAPSDEHPFAAKVDVASCPWNADHRLVRVSVKGKAIEKQRPASNLVFLLDVSGSMNRPNKHPLVVEGMKMLTRQLQENDSVAIVVYAGAAGLVLDSTCGDDKETILASLDRLCAGGSTAGGEGIQLAYETARDNFITGGTNRVILCTDGDFNVGVTGTDQLVRIAQENAKGNIFLSVLGFGMGNHNDAMMEQISNKGNGNYAFIDSKKEAEKVLVEQMGGTLVTIAKDVKIQIEFNPKEVAAYRLIGYENRILAAQDFNDDKKDAGEIGAGHTVTALYELVPAGGEVDVDVPAVDQLRFQKKPKLNKQADSGEWFMLKLRYKQPTGTTSKLIEVPVKDEGKSFSAMDADFKFAASVASFGMLLRKSPHKGDATFAAVEEIAGDGIGHDKKGRRTEFLDMVRKAKELSGE